VSSEQLAESGRDRFPSDDMFLTNRLLLLIFIALIATSSAGAQGDPHPAETAKANALTKSGNQKMRDGDFEGAIADFNQVIEIDKIYPENVQSGSYVNRGLAFQKKGDLDAALADFNKAIKLQSNNFYAYQNRAGLHEKRKEIDEALADYSKAIKLNSKFPFAYYGRGLILLKQGKDSEADVDFAKYLGLFPNGKDSLDKEIQKIREERVTKP
jgi:tetratricopeptide (TPR) repeat protein